MSLGELSEDTTSAVMTLQLGESHSYSPAPLQNSLIGVIYVHADASLGTNRTCAHIIYIVACPRKKKWSDRNILCDAYTNPGMIDKFYHKQSNCILQPFPSLVSQPQE